MVKVWECGDCGYERDGGARPRRCPDCGADSDVFEMYDFDDSEDEDEDEDKDERR